MAVSVVCRTGNRFFGRWAWFVAFGYDDVYCGRTFTKNGAIIAVGDVLDMREYEEVPRGADS